jgi:hypothetical protein
MRALRMGGVVTLVLFLSTAVVAAEEKLDQTRFLEEGYVPLFNGKDLSGWKVPEGDNGHWKAVDGVIDYDARSQAKGDKDLWTVNSFGDFILHIEWRFKQTSGLYPMEMILPDGSVKKDAEGKVITELRPNADSGIFLRGTGKAQINIWCWPVGSGELWGYRTDSSMLPEVRAAAVPKVPADKPVGEWNTFDITMKGDRLTVVLNGKTVIDDARLPGVPERGPIALQHHGGLNERTGEMNPASSLIQFRNVYIKRLDDESAGQAGGNPFTLTPHELGMVLKTPDGRVVLRYMTKKPANTELTANSVCCFYPVNTPSGQRVVDFAPSDHRHHRGIFLAWHSMKGQKKADFWGWGEWAPTQGRVITNRAIRLVEADSSRARLRIRNDWLVEGEAMIHELLRVSAREEKEAFVIDLDYRLTPTEEVTLDQTAFGGLCVKGRKDGKGVYTSPEGEVKLPNPHYLKPESDWPAADWYDYTIELNGGKTVGAAVLDHPDNPPTTWHNLAPIAMVNPCIVAPGPVSLKKGEPLRLRYCLVVHDGPTPLELLKQLSSEWRR